MCDLKIYLTLDLFGFVISKEVRFKNIDFKIYDLKT
jgi:hypothetical protein